MLKELSVVFAVLAATSVYANEIEIVDTSGFYIGGMAGNYDISNEFGNRDELGFGVILGYAFNEYMAVEGTADYTDFSTGDINADRITTTAAFRMSLPINDFIGVYGKAGYNVVNTQLQTYGEELESDMRGLYLAGGIEAYMTKSDTVTLSYNKYSVDMGDYTSVNVGITHRF